MMGFNMGRSTHSLRTPHLLLVEEESGLNSYTKHLFRFSALTDLTLFEGSFDQWHRIGKLCRRSNAKGAKGEPRDPKSSPTVQQLEAQGT